MPRKPRKPPTKDDIQAMGPDDDFPATLADIYRPMRDHLRSEGHPEHAVRAAVRKSMTESLLASANDDPRANLAELLFQAAAVLTPAFLILFPPPKPEDN